MADRISNERMFPVLSEAQVDRAASHGRIRTATEGEVLVEPSSPNTRFFIIKTAELEITHVSGSAEHFVTLLGPRQFTGETSLLAGRHAVVRIRATKPGE